MEFGVNHHHKYVPWPRTSGRLTQTFLNLFLHIFSLAFDVLILLYSIYFWSFSLLFLCVYSSVRMLAHGAAATVWPWVKCQCAENIWRQTNIFLIHASTLLSDTRCSLLKVELSIIIPLSHWWKPQERMKALLQVRSHDMTTNQKSA